MKYRIVELYDGKYKIQCKNGFLERWSFLSQKYENADDAKKDLLGLIDNIKRIVEVIE